MTPAPPDQVVRALAPVGRPVSAAPLTGGMFATAWDVRLADGRRIASG